MNHLNIRSAFLMSLLILLYCGCGGGEKSPAELIVGKWRADKAAMRETYLAGVRQQGLYDEDNKTLIENRIKQWVTMTVADLEFRDDKTYSLSVTNYDGSIKHQGKWSIQSSDAESVLVELRYSLEGKPAREELKLYFVGDDACKMFSPYFQTGESAGDALPKLVRVE